MTPLAASASRIASRTQATTFFLSASAATLTASRSHGSSRTSSRADSRASLGKRCSFAFATISSLPEKVREISGAQAAAVGVGAERPGFRGDFGHVAADLTSTENNRRIYVDGYCDGTDQGTEGSTSSSGIAPRRRLLVGPSRNLHASPGSALLSLALSGAESGNSEEREMTTSQIQTSPAPAPTQAPACTFCGATATRRVDLMSNMRHKTMDSYIVCEAERCFETARRKGVLWRPVACPLVGAEVR